MKIQLSGRHAVVSGSTAGIGYAIARGLAMAGASVTISGRTQARVDASVERLRGETRGAGEVRGYAADLGTAAGCGAFGSIVPDCDILVNNLGIFEPRSFLDIPDADWLRFFETNVMSGVRLTRQYLPAMVARGWGRVVFISSESGLQIPQEMVHYGMTKTAQLAIARGVAESVAGSGVTVNSVLPGPTRSDGVEVFLGEVAASRGQSLAEFETDFFTHVRPTSLLRRFATVEEVANMVVYVCSEQASATSGAALRVDGGVVRAIS